MTRTDTAIIDEVDEKEFAQETLDNIEISMDYVELNREVARERVVEVGYRLVKLEELGETS